MSDKKLEDYQREILLNSDKRGIVIYVNYMNNTIVLYDPKTGSPMNIDLSNEVAISTLCDYMLSDRTTELSGYLKLIART